MKYLVKGFNKTISLDKDFIFNISAPINKNNWHDYYYSYTNNLDNFSYKVWIMKYTKVKNYQEKEIIFFVISWWHLHF